MTEKHTEPSGEVEGFRSSFDKTFQKLEEVVKKTIIEAKESVMEMIKDEVDLDSTLRIEPGKKDDSLRVEYVDKKGKLVIRKFKILSGGGIEEISAEKTGGDEELVN